MVSISKNVYPYFYEKWVVGTYTYTSSLLFGGGEGVKVKKSENGILFPFTYTTSQCQNNIKSYEKTFEALIYIYSISFSFLKKM